MLFNLEMEGCPLNLLLYLLFMGSTVVLDVHPTYLHADDSSLWSAEAVCASVCFLRSVLLAIQTHFPGCRGQTKEKHISGSERTRPLESRRIVLVLIAAPVAALTLSSSVNSPFQSLTYKIWNWLDAVWEICNSHFLLLFFPFLNWKHNNFIKILTFIFLTYVEYQTVQGHTYLHLNS